MQAQRDQFVPLMIDGEPADDADIPLEALPDCETCDKPELDDSNWEAILLYQECHEQQMRGAMDGRRQGIRAEAMLAVLDELVKQGKIVYRERAWRRARILDDRINAVLNARLDAQQAKNEQSGSAS